MSPGVSPFGRANETDERDASGETSRIVVVAPSLPIEAAPTSAATPPRRPAASKAA
jgi:hypothetical protein